MLKPLTTLLAALAMAAIAAGCGSDDGGEEALTTASLGKAEYIEQVDDICARDRRKTSRELEAYVAQRSSNAAQSDGDEVFTEAVRAIFLPALQAKIEEIRALGAPSGDEDQVEVFLDAMQRTIDELNERSVGSLGAFGEELQPAADIARNYGFKSCG